MSPSPYKTFLVCHGAWGGGWSWKKMHPLMQATGHRLVTPTYTVLGERAHLASPAVDLETHIQDMLNVIHFEDLRDIVLVGHSYGGMVATGVADRARDRIEQTNPVSADTSSADRDWLIPRRLNMPIKCFETTLKLLNGETSLPRSYIYATRIAPADTFGQFAARARSEGGWRYFEIDASHSPNVTAPEALMALLLKIVETER